MPLCLSNTKYIKLIFKILEYKIEDFSLHKHLGKIVTIIIFKVLCINKNSKLI